MANLWHPRLFANHVTQVCAMNDQVVLSFLQPGKVQGLVKANTEGSREPRQKPSGTMCMCKRVSGGTKFIEPEFQRWGHQAIFLKVESVGIRLGTKTQNSRRVQKTDTFSVHYSLLQLICHSISIWVFNLKSCGFFLSKSGKRVVKNWRINSNLTVTVDKWHSECNWPYSCVFLFCHMLKNVSRYYLFLRHSWWTSIYTFLLQHFACDVVTGLLIFVDIDHFHYIFTYAHIYAHTHKNTGIISAQKERQEPGTRACLEGVEVGIWLDTKTYYIHTPYMA